MIWAPEQKFAEEVIEECAAFPFGDHDDLVDSTTQAIMRFRQGGLIGHPEDYIDEKAKKLKGIITNGNKIWNDVAEMIRQLTRGFRKAMVENQMALKK